ncbi:MAG: sensor histidine kinase, partial [Aquabacterium sp.]|nr:sensor histidine kinase [Ferruginibacter sp.]
YSNNHLANVALAVRQRQILVTIKDDGKGMAESELQNIFQPFYRADNTCDIAGFGLGLSLASRFIKLHKGEIEVQSQLNKGTTFTVILPVATRPGTV